MTLFADGVVLPTILQMSLIMEVYGEKALWVTGEFFVAIGLVTTGQTLKSGGAVALYPVQYIVHDSWDLKSFFRPISHFFLLPRPNDCFGFAMYKTMYHV